MTNHDVVEDGDVPSATSAALPQPSKSAILSGSLTCFGRVINRFSSIDMYELELDLSGQTVDVHASVLSYDLPLEVGDQVKVSYVDNEDCEDQDEDNVRIDD